MFIENLTDELSADYDNFITRQLERFGYSKRQLVEMALEGRLTRKDTGMDSHYYIDGVEVFTVTMDISELKDTGDGNYSYSVTVRCVDSNWDGPKEDI